MEHHFNTGIAKMYGIEEAVLLHNFYFWIAKNAANGKNMHDGLYWTYNSKRAYSEFFPYMNETKIFRVLRHLEEEGVVVKGNFSEDKWDRTNWYAITQKGLDLLDGEGYDMMPFSALLQNDTIDCVKVNDGACQSEQSILINNTYTDTDTKTKEKKEYKERFSAFVSAYKKMGGKVRGVDTEFNDFVRRHKDWKEVLPYLELAVQRETKQRQLAQAERKFFPEPKMLQTYLGKQRAWELYVTIGEDLAKEEYAPMCGGALNWNDYYNCYMYVGFWNGKSIADGYSDDSRPDGASITLNNGRGTIVWSREKKEWSRK